MNDPSRICLTCGGPTSHPTLLACIEFLRCRLDTALLDLTTVQQRQLDTEERLEQIMLNDAWLRDKVDKAHARLCPERCGTWQQRAEQLVEAAIKLTSASTKSEPR